MAKGKGKNTVETVTELCAPIAENMGLEIWDVRFEKEGSSWFLRVFVDKEGGVTIDDCENFSRAIDPVLDEKDPIDQSYYLEVSSPGIDRELVKPQHFMQYLESVVDVKTIRPVNGVREFTGVLKQYSPEGALVETQNGEMLFNKTETAYIKLNIDNYLGGNEEDE